MNSAFVVLFAAYVTYALATCPFQREQGLKHRTPRLVMVLQLPLFCVSCVLAWRAGLFSRALVSPFHVGAGVLLGHLLFCLSLFAVHGRFSDAFALFVDVPAFVRFLGECPRLILSFLVLSLTEELIYRVAAQSLAVDWLGPYAGIGGTALIFCLTHNHFYRNGRRESIEFALFSVAIGALFYVSGSLILVVLVHAMRNLEIAFVEFETHLHAHDGDTEAAWGEFELHYGPQ